MQNKNHANISELMLFTFLTIFQQAETKQQDQEKEKKWNILRDDYMMGAKMKDWNKESSDENDNGPGDPDISDSD